MVENAKLPSILKTDLFRQRKLLVNYSYRTKVNQLVDILTCHIRLGQNYFFLLVSCPNNSLSASVEKELN